MFPQLVWLPEHKVAVLGIAGVLLAGSGILIWRARRLPCLTGLSCQANTYGARRVPVRLLMA